MRDPAEYEADETDPERMAERAMAAAASSRALQAGAFAPDFRLPDHAGHPVSLLDLIAAGPAVLHFHRGTWCSFCHDSLQQLADAHGDIRAAGADMAAIAPATSAGHAAAAEAELQHLPFRTLTDRTMKVASTYGVAFTLPRALRARYLEWGYAPPAPSGAGEWLVPIPATYLIDRHGLIVLAAVDIDYRNRLQPGQVLSALKGLRRRDRPSL